jgi:N-acyl-D-amino-acid deacylase
VEAAVHQLTGWLSSSLRIRGRGLVQPGMAGDLVVFALDELHYDMESFVHDLPGGAPRLTRPPGGFRSTIVGGVVTQEAGATTGARPGGPLSS